MLNLYHRALNNFVVKNLHPPSPFQTQKICPSPTLKSEEVNCKAILSKKPRKNTNNQLIEQTQIFPQTKRWFEFKDYLLNTLKMWAEHLLYFLMWFLVTLLTSGVTVKVAKNHMGVHTQ
eukprot:TRINITY_DN480_c0_g1_i1.p1 TRINITY_DN480_c0_g1~~TRINITY_DN480_c0_g1_i1.p1  ORF type:complete len:119 (-),score=10.39 TRINITY_DN480_c0_g1_i1:735-1091(-)